MSSVENTINLLLDSCKNEGYLFAYKQALTQVKSDSFVCNIFTQNQFASIAIAAGNLPDQFVNLFPVRSQTDYALMPFAKWKKFLFSILEDAQDQGYPFASIRLDSIVMDSNQAKAKIAFEPGPLVVFDSIVLGGQVNVRPQYLVHLSGIYPGVFFRQALLQKFDQKINSLSFAQLAHPSAVYFYGNKAKPYLTLNPIKASTFDGIIGFAPKSSLNNSLILTGDFALKLVNLWGTGMQIETAFKSYLVGSKEMQFSTEIPYVRKIKLGIHYTFRLLKFDSIYLELNHEFGYKILEKEAVVLNLFYKNNHFSLINTDTNWVRANRQIPKLHDALSNQIGLQFNYRKADNLKFPRKAFFIHFQSSLLERNLLKNILIEEVKFLDNNSELTTVYAHKNLTSYQLHFFADIQSYLPISSVFNLKTQLSGAVINASQILQQEQFRIGGLKTLKGFDEQSLFTNQYISGNIEWRYLLPQNSSFILFYNQAWMNNQLNYNQANAIAKGFGAGMQINTSNGQLSLFYALGKINQAEFNFNAAKIHFGYNQLF